MVRCLLLNADNSWNRQHGKLRAFWLIFVLVFQFSGIEALITGLCDEYPRVLAKKREIFVGVVIALYYLGSLPTVTYGGHYVIPFLDNYGVSLSVLFIVLCEMVAVCWFYVSSWISFTFITNQTFKLL